MPQYNIDQGIGKTASSKYVATNLFHQVVVEKRMRLRGPNFAAKLSLRVCFLLMWKFLTYEGVTVINFSPQFLIYIISGYDSSDMMNKGIVQSFST